LGTPPAQRHATIALDGTPLTISTGGIARYTLELARALAAEFPEDQYWLLSDQVLLPPAPVPANLNVGDPPTTFLERKWWLFGLRQEMSRRGVDLFHGTDFSVPYWPSRPSVMTLHDLSPWREWGRSPTCQRRLEGCATGQPDAARVRRRTPLLLRFGLARMVITPSEAVRREAIEHFHLRPERVVAVPLAASSAFRPVQARTGPTRPSKQSGTRHGPAEAALLQQRSVVRASSLRVPHAESEFSKPYFLFVGTLEPRKNVTRLIEAWREVRKAHDVDLVLAGRLRPGFPAPEPEPGLRLLGPVPDADLPGLYSGALACVYPSLYEGFGLPVLEAMQCGAVVVTSRDPAIMEVSATAAIHVDATDTRALAQALASVAATPENFAAMRERALARAREFSWQRTARLTREVYEAAR
jgi:glycosyltransferase involved in cell wall biosynthesis